MDISLINEIGANIGVISAVALAAVAGGDKIALIIIKTLGNIRDAWWETFPKKQIDPPQVNNRWD